MGDGFDLSEEISIEIDADDADLKSDIEHGLGVKIPERVIGRKLVVIVDDRGEYVEPYGWLRVEDKAAQYSLIHSQWKMPDDVEWIFSDLSWCVQEQTTALPKLGKVARAYIAISLKKKQSLSALENLFDHVYFSPYESDGSDVDRTDSRMLIDLAI